MAANKFATMLHKNTHKLAVILVYAILEWVLIFLLLLNALFSYLIAKFANFFGLKPPCLWCSRVDHILEPGRKTHSYRDLVCEAHATEISKLGYCSDHHRLAESHGMCKDCLSSRPKYNAKSSEMSRTITFFSLVSGDKTENGEKNRMCSCCNESLDSKLHSPYLLFKPSWDVFDYTQKGSLIIEAMDEDNIRGGYSEPCKFNSQADHFKTDGGIDGSREDDTEGVPDEHPTLSDVGSLSFRDGLEEDCLRSVPNLPSNEEDEKSFTLNMTEQDSDSMTFTVQSSNDIMVQTSSIEDESLEVISMHPENHIEQDCGRFVPVELIDSSTIANQRSYELKTKDPVKHGHQDGTQNSVSPTGTHVEVDAETKGVSGEEVPLKMDESAENTSFGEPESRSVNDIENSPFPKAESGKGDPLTEACEQVVVATQPAPIVSTDGNNVERATTKEPEEPPAPEDGSKLMADETKSEILTGMEVFRQEPANQSEAHETNSLQCLREDQFSKHNENIENSSGLDAFNADKDLGPEKIEKGSTQERTILVDENQDGINRHVSMRKEPNETEEEKLPDTPTSVERLHYLHKKLLLFEKRESGTEESLDGSVVSEMEGGDGVLTIERLKAALKAEHKALTALYAELEEERSASAIAANQTMAMITRLQEEKAAMQMEALQYQRMMEEQSEYDQEALQLLNELMIKREKEKQELEKELEIYRKKVSDYEAKEKMMILKRRKDGSMRSRNSSASCSNAEDSDELSIDLTHEGRDEDSSYHGHKESSSNTPADIILNIEETGLDCVKHLSTLNESLAEFEEERLSILEQLKALEEKLFTLGDDDQFFEDVKPIEHFCTGSEFDENYDFNSREEHGVSNGFSEDLQGKPYSERKTMGSNAKRLLPLFDAIDIETKESVSNEEQFEYDSVEIPSSSVSKTEVENRKLVIEEEVDHVYQRLQALEADREFLKHCISSLKKGDKGMDLLQEILQHLRDLRSVELRAKNMGDCPLVGSCS